LCRAGYYSRFAVLRSLLLQFLFTTRTQEQRQVILLGAGYDTTYFQLMKESILGEGTIFIELDFKEVVQRKAAVIGSHPEMFECLRPVAHQGGEPLQQSTIDAEGGEVHSQSYRLQHADLRDLAQVEAALQRAGANFALPTFVLAECVLVYMQPQHSNELLRWLAGRLSTAAVAIYEQVNPNDAFGQQMMVNLTHRGCPLLGIVPSLEAHVQRLRGAGWERAETRSMAALYQGAIDPGDRRRIELLEIFDEFEEWNLIQAHYCVALGVQAGENGLLRNFGFPQVTLPKAPATVPK